MKNFTKFHERLNYLIKDVLSGSGNGVAKQLEMNQSILNRYLKGEANPPVSFVEKFCLEYSLSANYLILNVGPPHLKDLNITDIDITLQKIEEKKAMSKDLDAMEQILRNFRKTNSI